MKTNRLACSDPECASGLRGVPPQFIVRLEVTADGQVISDVDDIEDHYFYCSYCGAVATSEEAQPLNDDTGPLSPEEAAFEAPVIRRCIFGRLEDALTAVQWLTNETLLSFVLSDEPGNPAGEWVISISEEA